MAIYDLKTNNTSFLKMSKELKRLGIKNNKFFLILYDETLQGIDPFSKDLTAEQKIRINTECMRNKYYYLREIVRIPESGGVTQFLLNRANLALSWLMDNNFNVFEVLPRQNGKTIGAICNYTHIYNYATINTNMTFGNKQLSDSKLNLKRFNDIMELVPDYLKTHLNYAEDTNNIIKMECVANNNTIEALSSARTISDAEKLGRGMTTAILWLDEFAFLKYNSTVFASAAPAFKKASANAKKNGTPTGILITTTPNDRDSDSGAYAYDILSKACDFSEEWYDMDIQKVRDFVNKNSKNDFVYLEFNYKQLGHSEEWLEDQKRGLNHDLLKIKREILLEWTIANDLSPFSEEQFTEIEKYLTDSDSIERIKLMNGSYNLEIFRPIKNLIGKSWVLSIDVGGGLSRDYSAISLIDPLTYEQVGVFKNNTISVPDLAELLIELVTIYLPNAVVVPERNSSGIALIQLLLKSKISKNLYYEMKELEAEKIVIDPKVRNVKKTKSVKRYYGINTDRNTRPRMFNEILYTFVNENPNVFTNKIIFEELKSLERKTNGKIEHKDGGHDDVLMSWLVGMYVLLFGKNTGKFIKVVTDDYEQFSKYNNNINSNINRINNIVNNRDNINKEKPSYSEVINKFYEESPFDMNSIEDEENNVASKTRSNVLMKFLK